MYFNPTNLRDNRFVDLSAIASNFTQNNYSAQIDVLGKFKTGSISHQLLIGFDFYSFAENLRASIMSVPTLDVFNPDYSISSPNFVPTIGSKRPIQAYGIYLQDQITLLDNLKLLIGGRLDWIYYRRN